MLGITTRVVIDDGCSGQSYHDLSVAIRQIANIDAAVNLVADTHWCFRTVRVPNGRSPRCALNATLSIHQAAKPCRSP